MLLALLAATTMAVESPTPVHVLNMQPLAEGAPKQALVEAQRRPSNAHHVLHAHVGPDGRTLIQCDQSHAHADAVEQVVRMTERPR